MNDKLKNENVKNTNDNLEDLSSQEANVETIEKKDEVESLSERKKSIKDYLSKDLFADVKRISFNDDKPLEDKKKVYCLKNIKELLMIFLKIKLYLLR